MNTPNDCPMILTAAAADQPARRRARGRSSRLLPTVLGLLLALLLSPWSALQAAVTPFPGGFAVTPSVGFQIASLVVDGIPVTPVPAFTYTTNAPSHTVAIVFVLSTFTITASGDANGSVTPAGLSVVAYGTTPGFAITPNSGYHLATLLVDGAPAPGTTSYTFAPVTSNHTITATFAANAYTIVASAGPHGLVTPAGSTSYAPGATPTYAITPATGYHIAAVLVDGSALDVPSSYTFAPLAADHTISATFAIDTYVIVASAGPHGSVSPLGSTTANDGATPVYAITPASGYRVAEVLVDGSAVATTTSYTFAPVHADHTISATFAMIPLYTITATAGAHGSVTPAGASTVPETATPGYALSPASGYHLADVQVDGVSVGTSLTYTFAPVYADHALLATFALNAYAVVASSGPHGNVAPAGSTLVLDGDTATYTIVPAATYQIAEVLVDGVSVGQSATYTFAPVHAGHTISATFTLTTWTIVTSADGNGSVTPAGPSLVAYGATPAFAITPATGSHLVAVLVDGSSVTLASTYTFAPVTMNHTLNATFALNTYTIAASGEANGTVTPSGTASATFGTTPLYVFTADPGYQVATVLLDGVAVEPAASYTFAPVAADHTLRVTFAFSTYAIVATTGPNGSVAPAGVTIVPYGTTASYVITPAAGYHIVDVLVDGSSVGTVNRYRFTTVIATHTISATFVIDAGGPQAGPAMVDLGAAAPFVILAGSAVTVATPDRGLTGDVGLSPTTGAALTLTASQVVGTIYAVDATGPPGTVNDPLRLIAAKAALTAAYQDAATRLPTANDAPLDVYGGNLGGHTLTAGLYRFSSAALITGGDLTLTGGPNDVWIFQIGSSLQQGDGVHVILADRARAANIFWQVGTSAVLGTGSSFAGTILADQSITVGAGTTLAGRALAAIAAVTFSGTAATMPPVNHPPVALPDSATVLQGTTLTVAAPGVLANDSDPDADPVAAALVTVPEHGTLTFNDDGSYTYVPTPTYFGADQFSYVAADGALDSPAVTVSLTIIRSTYTIAATADAHGSLTPDGTQTATYGSTPIYAITPATGYHVVMVVVDGSDVGALSSYTFAAIAADHTLSASFAADLFTLVASSGANGSVTPAGSSVVAYGASQTYAITATTGYHTVSVLVDGSAVGAVSSYAFAAISANHTISAAFALNTFTVVIAAGPNGTVTNAGTTTMAAGSTVTSTPTANAGYRFVAWTTGSGTVVTLPYTVTADVTLTATFVSTATNPVITASAGTGGGISPSGAVSVVTGSTQTFTITPNAGWRIATITVDGVVQPAPGGGYLLGTPSTYAFGNVTSAHTLNITFAATLSVTLEAAGGGSASGSMNGDTQPLPHTWPVGTGTLVSLTVNVASGWTFAGFYNDPGTAGTTPAALAASGTSLAPFTLTTSAEIVAVFDTTGAHPGSPTASVIVRPKKMLNSADNRFFFGLPGKPLITDPSLLFAKASASNNAATFALQQFVNGTALGVSNTTLAALTGGEGLLAISPVGVAYVVQVVCATAPAAFQRTVAGPGKFASPTTALPAYNCGSPTQPGTTLNAVLGPNAGLANNAQGYHYTALFDASISLTVPIWNATFGGAGTLALVPGHCYQWKTLKGATTLTASGTPTDIPTF